MLVHISSGNGIAEVCRALWRFLKWLRDEDYAFEVIELKDSGYGGYSSILLRSDDNRFTTLEGTLLWRATSPFRPRHKRKNWYFSLKCYDEIVTLCVDKDLVIYQTMRSPKKGGQKVNTTESGVRAIYPPLSIEAISYDQRSQNQNRQIAFKRLEYKASLLHQQNKKQSQQSRWSSGKRVERGDPIRVFEGNL